MDKISDRQEFDSHIEAIRENAAGLPATLNDLTDLLGRLIEDALTELAGEKFAMPRSMGDLDNADGITHLFDDYPATIPPGGVFKVAFLTAEEADAARYLLKLYQARDSLNDVFRLPEDSIREIATAGLALLYWRQYGPAHDSAVEKRKEKQGSKKGGKNKAEKQKPKIDERNAKIQKRAQTMKGAYSKPEALDILEREFSKRFNLGRRQLANIVSSVFPSKPRRAKSSE